MKFKTRCIISLLVALSVLMSVMSFGFITADAAKKPKTANGFLDIEMEELEFDASAFEIISDKKLYSGGKALAPMYEDKTAPLKTDAAHVDASFTADIDGTYNIWMRHTAETANMSGQSMFLSLNELDYSTILLKATPEEPVWIKIGSVMGKAGEDVSVRIRLRQKFSIGLDRLVITTDNAFTATDVTTGIISAEDAAKAEAEAKAASEKLIKNAATVETKDGYVMVEAEKTTVVSNFSEVGDVELSGKKGLYIQDGATSTAPETQPHLLFKMKADKPGDYYLWVNANTTTVNKSLGVSFNNGAYATCLLGAPAEEYAWRNLGKVAGVKAGDEVVIRVIGVTTYLTIDNFVVTNNAAAVPEGKNGKLAERDISLPDGLYDMPDFTPPAEHPRLYFKKSDIPTILENAQKNENLAAWVNFKNSLNIGFTAVLPPPNPGMANVNSNILGYIEAHAFEYAINGTTSSGKKAIEEMKNYMDTVVYIDPNNDNYTRNAGHTIFTMSEVYDWCYDLLTDADKDYFISAAIATTQNGIEVGWPPSLQSSVTSHGSEAQILRDLMSFAIVTYDERPDIWNTVAGRLFSEYVPARKYVNQSHMFHQGAGYGSYRGQWDYNSAYMMDRLGMGNIYGDDLRLAAYWFLYARRPDGQLMRDGDYGLNGSIIGAYNGNARVMMLAGNYFEDPYLKREAARGNKLFSSFSYGHGNTSPVEFLIFNNPDVKGASVKDLPLTMYYPGPMGNMIARTGWDDGMDSPAVVAYMKVNEVWFANHQHLDAGSFQIYYKGILANDSGRYQGYATDHDLTYNKRSIAHNTITVLDPDEKASYYGSTTNDGGQRVPANGSEHMNIDYFINQDENKIGSVEGWEYGPDPVVPEYSYLKGDITKAYSEKIEDYERSFMFFNLNDSNHPAAMVVFDRVVAAKASFKKAWLLHGPAEPEISGNRLIYRNTENGYNGKLTVDTLLPKADNIEYTVYGGPGQEAWVDGANHSAGTNLDPTKVHESDGYRAEISPKTAAKTDYFLNVLQVGDAAPDMPALDAALIETDKIAGAVIADRVAVFNKTKGRTKAAVEFSFAGEGTFKIQVADVEAGKWTISRDGAEVGSAVASEDGGILYFEGTAGSYKLTFADAKAVKEVKEAKIEKKDYIDLRVDDKFVYTDSPCVIRNDRTLVPLRAIFEAIGAQVSWDSATRTATGTYDGDTVSLKIDDTTAYVNGNPITLDVPAMIINDRTMVPVRFVSESLYCTVDWDESARCVYVSKPDKAKGQGFDADGNKIYPPLNDIENSLTIYKVEQSDSDGNNIDQSLDGYLETRWAVEGTELSAWGVYDLGDVYKLDKVYISYYNGDSRIYSFGIAVSTDGVNYTRVIQSGLSSGKTNELEGYDLGGIEARYVKYLGNGNTTNMWNSVTEVVITEKK